MPARDPAGLVEILDQFGRDGFTAEETALEGGDVRCGSCHEAPPIGSWSVDHLRRTEGASDPGDMSAVLAVTCPSCETKGTLTVRYGPEASTADADVLSAVAAAEGDPGTGPVS